MIAFLLQVSDSAPTQFRITALEVGPDPGFNSKEVADAIDAAGFRSIGIYHTPGALSDALEPYLQMEAGTQRKRDGI